uniref:RIKEN cDNA 4933412E24 gene n=1 Tax=Mus spicilegus TaxID=10103 RepID=A0A8C6H7M8_MUSSI
MGSSEEQSVPGDDFYEESGDLNTGLSLVLRPAKSNEDESSLSSPKGSKLTLVSQLEASENPSVVLWAGGYCPDSLVPEEERVGSPMDEKVVGLDFLSQPSVETTATGQQVTNLETKGAREHPSPESFCAETEAGSIRRAPQASGSEEAKAASAGTFFPKGLEQSRAWVTPRKSTTSRMVIGENVHHPTSEPEPLDELNEVQMMRVTICLKDGNHGNQAKNSGPAETGDLARHSNVQTRDSFMRMPSSLLVSTTRGLTSGVERQASKEPEPFSSKKKQGTLWGKGGSKSSYPEAAAGIGALPKASPRKKMAQKKKPLWDASAVTLGRAFHQWGQRLKSAPAEPATFPPISGVGLPGRSNKCSLLPLRPKQCKNLYTGKRSGAKKTKELQLVAKEDTDSTRDPSSQVQFPTHRAEPPCQSVHQEFNSGDINARSLQDAGNSQSSALNQRGIMSKKSALSGDEEEPVGLPAPDSEILQLPGTQGCPRCPELQKEIEDLRKQLSALQAVSEKFQTHLS